MNKAIKFLILFSILLLTAVLVYFQYPGERKDWRKTTKINTLGAYEYFIEQYPNSEHKAEASQFIDSVRGSFIDSRTNREYKTVKIGKQEWMAENLAYLPDVCPLEYDCGYWVYNVQDTSLSAAINSINFMKYGALYNFEEAQNVCPDGWHLPSDAEWDSLGVAVNAAFEPVWRNSYNWPMIGKRFKAYHSWDVSDGNWGGNGTDDFGFAGIPAGMRYPRRLERKIPDPEADLEHVDSKFDGEGKAANFWTSTEDSQKKGWFRWFSSNNDDYGQHYIDKHYGLSVRCVKDEH